MRAGRCTFVRVFQGDEALFDALSLLSAEDVGSNEVGIKGAEEAQTCFEWGFIGGEVGAVERVAHFKAEAISSAETTGSGTCFDESSEPRNTLISRAEELEPVFAGVSGATEDEVLTVVVVALDAVVRRQLVWWKQGGKDRATGGALDSESDEIIRMVFKGHAVSKVSREPSEVFIDFGSIDDGEKDVGFNAINDEVVNDTCLIVQHDGVLALVDIQLRDVIGEHRVEPRGR